MDTQTKQWIAEYKAKEDAAEEEYAKSLGYATVAEYETTQSPNWKPNPNNKLRDRSPFSTELTTHVHNIREYLRGKNLMFLSDDVRKNMLEAIEKFFDALYVENVTFSPKDIYWHRMGSGGSRWTKRSEWNKCEILYLHLAYAHGDRSISPGDTSIFYVGEPKPDGKYNYYLPLGFKIRPQGKRGFIIQMDVYSVKFTLARFDLPHEWEMLKEVEFNLCREYVSWQQANIDGKSHPLLYDSEDKCKREVEKVLTKLGLITD